MYSKRIQEKVKDDYNKIAKEFSDSRSFPWKEFEDFLPYYKKTFSVLDLGCGNGRLFKFLSREGVKSYLGIDNSEGLIKLAKSENSKAKFLCKDFSKKIVLGRKFDAIFAIASFHHLPRKDQLSVLKNWKKLLKPGGYLFMTNWNLWQIKFLGSFVRAFFWPKYGFLGLQIPWKMQSGKMVKRFYYAFTVLRLKKLLREAGFELVSFKKGRNFVTIARV